MAQASLQIGKRLLDVRTMWNSAIWKYSRNHPVCGAIQGQRQGSLLVVQTQVFSRSEELTARPALASVMSPALHDVAVDCFIDDSWAA